MGFLHLIGVAHQFLIHFFYIPLADRQVIRRIVLALPGLSDTLYVQLQRALKAGGIRHNINIVHRFKIIDPLRIGIPDLGVHRACLILQNQVFVCFSIFCNRRLTLLAQIDTGNALAFPDSLNIFHLSYSPHKFVTARSCSVHSFNALF